ncbi:Lysophospholipase L1 [Bifidobacterium bohemicum]|uniref:Putative lipolytic enzyme, G-D-S-L n=1 Tax=Bifidobacterium bohemicum DSM 22767 TaxID=1437606 RepID=A0A086ZJG6_9BIFI|nr:GDSL-type esterase/lipase family protein [Bifidobacterium bohemicum]KFI46666.1 putative lipolytic enzyme, G-D-S-L [Bifidobacterium bohemicum DSM 22767]SCB78189.1 Lysophospholipase L1 [Bifidobacterium bohemicum]
MTIGIGTPVATIEALWAKHTIHLADEPSGQRSGLVSPPADSGAYANVGAALDSDARAPLRLCAIGDSMVAGCGTPDQRDGLIPAIASGMAEVTGWDVQWQAHGKLGATMRRLRYRILPEVLQSGERFDFLLVCAGSNDIMANRSLSEWRDDLEAVLVAAQPIAERIFVLSPGQMQHEPSLGRVLRRVLEREMDAQAAVSNDVCVKHGAVYINLIHDDVHASDPGFFSPDHFHPSPVGYGFIAQNVVADIEPMLR